MSEHEHKHDLALGGFWIKPDGSSEPVLDRCGHRHTLMKLGISGGYDAAYRAGWVRISSCCIDDEEVSVKFLPEATVAALRSAAAIIRHRATTRKHVAWLFEEMRWERHEWVCHWLPGNPVVHDWRYEKVHFERFDGDNAAQSLARLIMQRALVKNAAAKQSRAA